MGPMRWILVGLGNPGAEYAKTRHNAGRIALEALRQAWGFPEWEYKKSYDALVSRGEIAGKEALLLLPETYMNESGKSLVSLIKSADAAAQLVVLHDDADLALGGWRFSYARGTGGQKGVASIVATLKTKDFVRLRIGISPNVDPDAPHVPAGEYVLAKFRAEDHARLLAHVPAMKDEIERLVTEGLDAARSKWKRWEPNDR